MPRRRRARRAPCAAIARGVRDRAETCSGSSAQCPTDGRITAGTVCRGIAGSCDVSEACTGASDDCPADAFLPTGTVARPR
ncbi:MAG: hypothetical protein U0325_15085 [Polyangiales bacterium]